jgi:hypothetical protein
LADNGRMAVKVIACAKIGMQNATPKSTLRPAFYMRVSFRGG